MREILNQRMPDPGIPDYELKGNGSISRPHHLNANSSHRDRKLSRSKAIAIVSPRSRSACKARLCRALFRAHKVEAVNGRRDSEQASLLAGHGIDTQRAPAA